MPKSANAEARKISFAWFESLLSYLAAQKLIITGFAADICVLFTADDAYMQDYELVVTSDKAPEDIPRGGPAKAATASSTEH